VITPIQRFNEAIKSEQTKKTYKHYLNQFFKHAGTNAESFVKMDKNDIDDLVFQYLVSLKMLAGFEKIIFPRRSSLVLTGRFEEEKNINNFVKSL